MHNFEPLFIRNPTEMNDSINDIKKKNKVFKAELKLYEKIVLRLLFYDDKKKRNKQWNH